MNIADQAGINERGEVIDKKQLTHNQSMTYSSGTSLNNKTIKDDLQDVMYGSCLCRVIHQIVEYRKRHPKVRILIQKVDFKSAYCHSHLDPATVIQTITQFVLLNLCFISLCLTFRGAPNPNIWSEISESITDLANAILQCKEWDQSQVKSPLQSLIPDYRADDSDPREFTQALDTAVNVEVQDEGQVDCYIGDLTTIILDLGTNLT